MAVVDVSRNSMMVVGVRVERDPTVCFLAVEPEVAVLPTGTEIIVDIAGQAMRAQVVIAPEMPGVPRLMPTGDQDAGHLSVQGQGSGRAGFGAIGRPPKAARDSVEDMRYRDLKRAFPALGSRVMVGATGGTVISLNVKAMTYRIRLDDGATETGTVTSVDGGHS